MMIISNGKERVDTADCPNVDCRNCPRMYSFVEAWYAHRLDRRAESIREGRLRMSAIE